MLGRAAILEVVNMTKEETRSIFEVVSAVCYYGRIERIETYKGISSCCEQL